MLMAAEERKPRVNAIICGRLLDDGSICNGVCDAKSSPARFTYYKCRSCKVTKKVSRPTI